MKQPPLTTSDTTGKGRSRAATRPAGAPAQATRNIVVLDTSVVMTDPNAHLEYAGADIVIPLTVIDELDRNKTRSDAAGRNARHFLHTLEALRLEQGVTISEQFDLPDVDATLRIEPNGLRLDEIADLHWDIEKADHRIIAAALGLARDGRNVKVVSNDTALRVKASFTGLEVAEHTPGRIGVHAPNRTGYHDLPLSNDFIDQLKLAGRAGLPVDELSSDDRGALDGILENEFVIVSGTAICARYKKGRYFQISKPELWGAKAKNKEQAFAMDLLADEDVTMVALRGHAGTGKSLLGIAAGLHAVLEAQTHNHLLIVRPMISVGRQDIGFLPGDIAEKTQPWFDAIIDVLLALQPQDENGHHRTYKQAKEQLDMLIDQGLITLAPVTFLRGRTFHRTFVICDEAQNVDQSTIKTIISRLGKGSRLVLNGDDGQIDVPFASSVTCGLNVAVDAFAGEDLFGQVFFSKGERSRLADLAAERM